MASKGLGHRDVNRIPSVFIFESGFTSNRPAESAMNVGSYMIIMVKTSTKELCKDIIDNLSKYCPGGS